MNKRELGTIYEDKACAYLAKEGYRIICRNYRCRYGEIDIIAMDKDVLCFVEVKYRRNFRFGSPAQAVTSKKQYTIIKVARWYLLTNKVQGRVRFDVISADDEKLTLYKGAFGG